MTHVTLHFQLVLVLSTLASACRGGSPLKQYILYLKHEIINRAGRKIGLVYSWYTSQIETDLVVVLIRQFYMADVLTLL